MLNMIRMDMYRLFKSRSMYVIWMILACFLLGTTYTSKMDMDAAAGEGADSQIEEEMEEEPVALGMAVELPTKPGEKVTVYDEFYANTQGKVMALFIVIFTVLFSTADSTSGYIKSVAGQVQHRGKMILSKTLAILLFTVMTMGLAVFWQALCHQLLLGYARFGDGKFFGRYFVVQVVLHFALALVCMCIASLVRNNVVSMIFAVCLCMNFLILLCGVIDNFIQKIGYKDFSVIRYTVSGKISLLPMNLTGKDGIGALLVSVIFILVMTSLTSVVFEKRDVV